MKKEKIKVYIYTRVSTAMQIDGYSLDAQKSRMKAYAEFNDYEIVGEYEDAGKSGKSIEGRVEFNRMMEDIKSGKDGVSTDAPHSSNCVSTFCSMGNLYAIAFTKRFCVFCSSRGNNSTSEIRYFTRSRRSAAFILS